VGGKLRIPVTPAIRALRAAKVEFVPRLYEYVERGGTRTSAAELGVDEHCVIKTLVMETSEGVPLIVLMHGDREVSTKSLARHLGVKGVVPCRPDVANRHTGYQVGGTSPFGTRTELAIYMQKSIAELPRVFINGGKRGFLVELDPAELRRVLHPELVEVATSPL
jgi:Cys-tRNA(Pro) deacylase